MLYQIMCYRLTVKQLSASIAFPDQIVEAFTNLHEYEV